MAGKTCMFQPVAESDRKGSFWKAAHAPGGFGSSDLVGVDVAVSM